MNHHHPTQPDHSDQPNQQDQRAKKNGFNQGWLWLLVAAVGIGVVFFGFSGLTEQMSGVNQSIQENTQAIQEQSHLLSGIKQDLQQLVIAIKDSVLNIIQAISYP